MSAIASDVLQEAADWFACMADPEAGEGERQRWQAWLAAHPDHVAAWRKVEAVTSTFVPLAGEGGIARLALEVPSQGRRKALRALAVMLVSGGGALVATRMPWREMRHTLALHGAHHRVALGEIRTRALDDGGRVWLGSLGAMDIEYGSSLRRLALYRGDLLVETAQDTIVPARPFMVDTFHGRLRALGTRFAVRVAEASTRVDVFEGKVEVAPQQSGAGSQVVGAGSRAVFDRLGIVKSGAADPARSAWARGVLLADGLRLDELLAEVSRWHALSLTCAPEIAGLRVVGAYPLQNPDRILSALAGSLPIVIKRHGRAVHITHRI